MAQNDPDDPFRNFPGGNPFGAGSPFGAGDPWRDMDEFLRRMGMDPKEFRNLFEEMQRNLQEAFKDLGERPDRPFVQGFSVRMGPDGKPRFSSFGNKPQMDRGDGAPSLRADEREPLTDVIEDKESVAITMELPGVEKNDIDVHMTEDQLEISVDTEKRKYHKRVRLPAKVEPATTKATYNNGILDVTVTKQKGADGGVRIPVE